MLKSGQLRGASYIGLFRIRALGSLDRDKQQTVKKFKERRSRLGDFASEWTDSMVSFIINGLF